MPKNNEDRLFETINSKQTFNDRPVLVQNQLGIFYGILQKADTRQGTALLSDGYMVDPDRHVTFAQYEALAQVDSSRRSASKHSLLEKLADIKISETDSKQRPIGESMLEVPESRISQQTSTPNITDFAANGIMRIHRPDDTSSPIHSGFQFSSDISDNEQMTIMSRIANTHYAGMALSEISLTGIYAIVPVSDRAFQVRGFGADSLGELLNLTAVNTFQYYDSSYFYSSFDIAPLFAVSSNDDE